MRPLAFPPPPPPIFRRRSGKGCTTPNFAPISNPILSRPPWIQICRYRDSIKYMLPPREKILPNFVEISFFFVPLFSFYSKYSNIFHIFLFGNFSAFREFFHDIFRVWEEQRALLNLLWFAIERLVFSTDHRERMERENVETNTSIKWPVADRERDPPRRGYTVAVEEVGGSWRVPLSRFLAGVPRDWMALLPGRHRDARFRSIILTAESMISPLGAGARARILALLSFISLRFSPPFLPFFFLSFFLLFAFATRAPLLSQTTAVKATWLF